MQDITLQTIDFEDVPAVNLPKTGGGLATFIDPSGTTATAEDVAAGKMFFDALGVLTEGTSSGGGLEYESGVWTTDADVIRPVIQFSRTRSKCPGLLSFADATDTQIPTSTGEYTSLAMVYANYEDLFGGRITYNGVSNWRYGQVAYYYRGSANTSTSYGTASLAYPSTTTTASSVSYPRYWVTPSSFTPSASSSSYWRPGRTYKWIAIWT